MTKQQAHALLNAAQAGLPASPSQITEALMATGDLDQKTAPKPDFSFQPVASFLNRSGRVMRGAGEVLA